MFRRLKGKIYGWILSKRVREFSIERGLTDLELMYSLSRPDILKRLLTELAFEMYNKKYIVIDCRRHPRGTGEIYRIRTTSLKV